MVVSCFIISDGNKDSQKSALNSTLLKLYSHSRTYTQVESYIEILNQRIFYLIVRDIFESQTLDFLSRVSLKKMKI